MIGVSVITLTRRVGGLFGVEGEFEGEEGREGRNIEGKGGLLKEACSICRGMTLCNALAAGW